MLETLLEALDQVQPGPLPSPVPLSVKIKKKKDKGGNFFPSGVPWPISPFLAAPFPGPFGEPLPRRRVKLR